MESYGTSSNKRKQIMRQKEFDRLFAPGRRVRLSGSVLTGEIVRHSRYIRGNILVRWRGGGKSWESHYRLDPL